MSRTLRELNGSTDHKNYNSQLKILWVFWGFKVRLCAILLTFSVIHLNEMSVIQDLHWQVLHMDHLHMISTSSRLYSLMCIFCVIQSTTQVSACTISENPFCLGVALNVIWIVAV